VFSRSGARVWRLTRCPSSSNHFDWEQLQRYGLPVNTQIVVNACGQNILEKTRRWSDALCSELFESRVHTSQLLASALLQANDRDRPNPAFPVYLGISGVAVYSDKVLEAHDEQSTVTADHLWADLCRQLEQAAAEPLREAAIRCVLMRTGVVLGRDGGLVRDLWLPFLWGFGARIGSGRQPMPWIHLHDLAELTAYLADRSDASGVVNAVAPTTATNAEFTRQFARALNRPAWLTLPKCAMRIVFGADRARLVLRAPHVMATRAKQLGFSYSYPTLEKACAQLVSR
jgi:uncharacterized protein (TIGR01777 family)